jgi:uncharacterized membrane protein YdcZ (DUF606 family)
LTVSSFAVNAFMHEKSPIAGGAIVGLVCGIFGWVGEPLRYHEQYGRSAAD